MMREMILMRDDMGEDHFASLVGDIALYTAFIAGCYIILRILTNFDQAVCLVGVFGHIVMVEKNFLPKKEVAKINERCVDGRKSCFFLCSQVFIVGIFASIQTI
eukprot:UN25231